MKGKVVRAAMLPGVEKKDGLADKQNVQRAGQTGPGLSTSEPDLVMKPERPERDA